jgi:4-diphosphocytidyl-2-C-methyl-D-erythritol kinase
MIRAIAAAKVNLSLRVGARQPDGLHNLAGLFQSVSWVDRLTMRPAAEDQLVGESGRPVIAGWDNLAWRAVEKVRGAAGSGQRVAVTLDKQVPAAAGLGGGSADAAAALAAAGRLFGVGPDDLLELAPGLGSDVPFCFRGGTAEVTGTGAALRPLDPIAGYALALVVPPIELATGDVYNHWDELGKPEGPTIGGADLPPLLRKLGPLGNDLYPAAASLAPALDDWRADLSRRWSRPVLLTGSGPTLFAYFLDRAEAAAALDIVPPGARAAAATVPIPFGWALELGEGEYVPSARTAERTAEMIPLLFAPGHGP